MPPKGIANKASATTHSAPLINLMRGPDRPGIYNAAALLYLLGSVIKINNRIVRIIT